MMKNIKTWIIIAIATVLGLLGISKLLKLQQESSAQQQALIQAQNLVAETENINNVADLNTLKGYHKKLQETISTLEKIPNLPGLPYLKAQRDLDELRPLSAKVESQLKTEEQASTSLDSALKLDQEAAKLVEAPYSPENWQQAQDKWEQAITILQKISSNTFIADAVKKGLIACQRNYANITQQLAKEDNAFQNLDSAIDMAEKAAQLTANHPYTMPDLINAKVQWQTAINLLTNIPSGSTASQEIASQLVAYRKNYINVSDAIDQIRKCMINNSSLESSCTDNVVLNITAPDTTAFNDDSASENSQATVPTDENNADSNSNTRITKFRTRNIYVNPYSRNITSSGLNNGSVSVRSYTRSNGTHVQGYSRSSPGSRVGGLGSSRSGGALS